MTEQGSSKKSDSAEGPVVRDAAKTLLSTEQVGASWVDICFFRWNRCPPVTDNTAVQPFCSWLIVSFLQVRETIEWLSTSFCKLRLASVDFRTFGLFSKWTPYVPVVNTFLEYLIKRLIDIEVANLAQEPVGSSRILAGIFLKCKLRKNWHLISLIPSVTGQLNIQ